MGGPSVVAYPPPMLTRLDDGLYTMTAPLRFFGIEVGTRMTVLQLDGGLLLHSPLDVPAEALGELGEARWVLAPNKLHHLFVGPWLERGAEGWAAPGLAKKRSDLSFAGEVTEDTQPFGDEVQLIPTRSFPFANEVALLHRPSRTLVLTDLVFNIPSTAPWLTRTAMWCACGHPGCRSTILERTLMNRAIAGDEIAGLLELDFDRLVMSHGEVVETDGKAALENAYRWL